RRGDPESAPRHRLSLKIWLGLPALVVLLGLAVAATILIQALEDSRHLLETIVESDNAFVFAAADGRQRIEALNGRLHQILLLRATDAIDDTEAQERLNAVERRVGDAVNSLMQVAAAIPDREAAEQVQRIAAELDTYRGTVGVIAVMFEVDLPTAVSFIEPFDKVFEQTSQSINAVFARAQAEARRTGERLDRERRRVLVLVAVVCGSVMLAALLTAYIAGRFIVQSVRRIAAVTRQLAGGDTQPLLHTVATVPEFDPIIDSLRVFRQNLREMAFLREAERQKELHRVAREQAERMLVELRATQAQLVEAEKMAALGQMVAGVAHEINTPLGICLTAISYFRERLQAIERSFAGGTMTRSDMDAFIRRGDEVATLTLSNLERVDKLIASFKKIAVDQTLTVRQDFDLAAYLAQVATSQASPLHEAGVTLETALNPVTMDSYPGALAQVVGILLSNCLVHAFPPAWRGGRIVLSCRGDGDGVMIVCADDGAGMNDEIAKRAFDPFFTTKRGQGANGLGLSIAYNLVTKTLGGEITLRSAPGDGTTVAIRVPVRAPVGAAREPVPA
ncbi:MAG: HAMP domain-containing histidine kinase, partial [Alphaproteobacteria bacterium]|nr:HAMP domain-containing histidine kinase [Alphaproteobacteria bacterium]